MTDAALRQRPVPVRRFAFDARGQRMLTIFLFLVVPLFSLLALNIYPVIELIYISFTNFNGISWSRLKIVALRNYADLLSRDSELLAPMINSFYYLGGSLLQLLLATWFAVTLNQKLPGSQLFRTILFLPFVLNTVASAMVFRHFLALDGALNDFLRLMFGPGAGFAWLDASKDYTNFSLAAASVWRYLGFNLVVIFGVLQSIPQDQYDAAKLEGANGWQQFWRITFPSIKLVLLLQIMLSAVGSLEVFEIPILITGGAGRTSSFAIEMLQTGFKFRRAGMAAAMAVFMLLIVVIFYLVIRIINSQAKLTTVPGTRP